MQRLREPGLPLASVRNLVVALETASSNEGIEGYSQRFQADWLFHKAL
jgi:hypothetical protein